MLSFGPIPWGVLRISIDGDDRMGAKIKTQKDPYSFQQNPKNSLDQKLTPKKSHAEFPSLKIFQKVLNDITLEIKTLEIECLSLFIQHTI